MRHVVVSPCSTVEVLPACFDQEDIKLMGMRYTSRVGKCKLSWCPTTPLSAAHNPIASALSGSHVAGDCLVEMPLPDNCDDLFCAEAMLTDMVAAQKVELNRLNQWAMLPPEVLGIVCSMAGFDVNVVLNMSHVCTAWRGSLSEEKPVWRKLQIRRIKILSSSQSKYGLPWLVKNAVQAGNVRVIVCVARLFHFDPSEGLKYWSKAAKRGHPEAQWHLGVAHYKGLHGMSLDSEEATMWLGRAAKQLLDALGSSGDLPPLMSVEKSRHVLSQSANILGYMALDGEGMHADTSVAVKWFKVALENGCAEASRVLGSLFRSGQF